MDPFDTGVIWGTGQGGMWTFENEVMDLPKETELHVSILFCS
jgi:3-oxoacyl-[acyl-carrier-protein] synthase II